MHTSFPSKQIPRKTRYLATSCLAGWTMSISRTQLIFVWCIRMWVSPRRTEVLVLSTPVLWNMRRYKQFGKSHNQGWCGGKLHVCRCHCCHHCCHCLPCRHHPPWTARAAAASSRSNDDDNRDRNPVVDKEDREDNGGDMPLTCITTPSTHKSATPARNGTDEAPLGWGRRQQRRNAQLVEIRQEQGRGGKSVSFIEDIQNGNQHTTSTWPWCCNRGVEETTVDKLRAEANTIDDEQQADVRMVAPTATHNNQHACCVLGVPTFFPSYHNFHSSHFEYWRD